MFNYYFYFILLKIRNIWMGWYKNFWLDEKACAIP